MLVGLQKQGKTTLLSRLREVNEVDTNTTTFTERVTGGEAPPITTSFKPSALLKRFGVREGWDDFFTARVLYMIFSFQANYEKHLKLLYTEHVFTCTVSCIVVIQINIHVHVRICQCV